MTLLLALAPISASSRAQSPATASAPTKYELPAIPDDFKDADAIILSWDQKWTVAPDGSITQHENKRVLIKNDRAIGAFADPRITFNKDWQTVNVLVARTITPDGRVTEVPPYSRNTVAPSESGGWPAFAAIQQVVLTYSAIEPGAILELEWERVTKPGMKQPVLTKPDLRIAERISLDYPTLLRTIEVVGIKDGVHRWTNVAADRDEAQSIPASERSTYFSYSTEPMSLGLPARALLIDDIDQRFGAGLQKKIAEDVKKWTLGRLGAVGKAREIYTQFGKFFNVVNVNEEFVPDPIRPLDKIYESRYGSRREATALLFALFKEAGLDVEPYLVASGLGKDSVLSSWIADFGVMLMEEGIPTFWTAANGRMRNPLSSRNQFIVTGADSSAKNKTVREMKLSDEVSEISVTGNITVAADHKWSGQVDLTCTGVFCDAPALRTEDERKNFAREIVERVLPKCIVESTSIASLSDNDVRLGAKIKCDEPLAAADGHRLLQLATAGPFSRSIGVPLTASLRHTDLRLASRFEESIALAIELPKDITLVSMPRDVEKKGGWGSVKQTTRKSEGGRFSFERRTTVTKRDIPAGDYPSLREALSEVQTESARTFIWKTPADAAQKVN